MAAKMQKREVIWLLILCLVLGGSWFNKNYYGPRVRKIKGLRASQHLLQDKIAKLEAENLNLTQKEDELKAYETELNRQKSELLNLETVIPKRRELDQLLYYLTHDRKGVEFESIKPLESSEMKKAGTAAGEENPGYKAQNYEINLSGNFADVVCYLRYLDSISPFAKVSHVVLKQNNEKKENRLSANVRLSILISDEPGGKGSTFQVNNVPKYKDLKNPFYEWKAELKVEKKQEVTKKEPPKLDIRGIGNAGTEFRVIIGEKIYKVGDTVGECSIREIQKDKLVIENAGTMYEIPIEKPKETKNN